MTGSQGGPGAGARGVDATHSVTLLYREHALGLTRLAFLMLGDRFAAEDVVQEAFCGLYRAWDRLPSHDNVLGYLRVSVLNGCRSVMRRARRAPRPVAMPTQPLRKLMRYRVRTSARQWPRYAACPPVSARRSCFAISPTFLSTRPPRRWG